MARGLFLRWDIQYDVVVTYSTTLELAAEISVLSCAICKSWDLGRNVCANGHGMKADAGLYASYCAVMLSDEGALKERRMNTATLDLVIKVHLLWQRG
jgi:hypothetical protein